MKKRSKGVYYMLSIAVTIGLLGCGDKDKDEKINVKADFEASSTKIEAGETVTFNNLSENAEYYQWDFDDGEYSLDENPSHTFEDAGTYNVSLVAIGDGVSDTAKASIEVEETDTTPDGDEITIFDGEGVKEVTLGDTYGRVELTFGTDTIYVVQYYEDFKQYSHIVYYKDKGLAIIFVSDYAQLYTSDQVIMVWVFSPYTGTTQKGIIIGSKKAKVKAIYGTPEDTFSVEDIEGYLYPGSGIDFYEFEGTGYIEEIDVYPADSNSKVTGMDISKSSSVKCILNNKGKIREYIKGVMQ